MKCVICKHGQTKPGFITSTIEREMATVVVKNVPAEVCDVCGEGYFSKEITEQLLTLAEKAVEGGVQVDVRNFVAA